MKIAKHTKYQAQTISPILFLFFIACMPDPRLPEAPDPVTENQPEFEQYAIPEYQIYKDKPRPVNLVSHPRLAGF